MKKSKSRVISAGLASISVLSPILDNGVSVLAISDDSQQISNEFDWVNGTVSRSKAILKNDTAEGKFWFCNEITKTLYAKGGTYIDFLVDTENLGTKLVGMELINTIKGGSIAKSTNTGGKEVSLSIPLADITSSDGLVVVLSYEDGREDSIPFYDYFTSIKGGVLSHIVDGDAPALDLEERKYGGGTLYDNKYYKGTVKYVLQSEKFDKLLPNIWGTEGYRCTLSINNEDYSNSNVVSINYNNESGKIEALVNFDNILKPYSGEYNIKLSVSDILGNVSEYTDKVYVDYVAPLVEGSVSSNYWVDSTNGITYFSSANNAELSYTVTDEGSGIKSVTILKNGVEVSTSNNSTGTFALEEGVYAIKAEDNMGNVKVYNLSDIVPGLADSVKFDNSAPNITVNNNNIDSDWFKDNSTISVDITDDIALKSVRYSINGDETVIDVKGNSYSLVIDKSHIKDTSGVLSVSVVACDMLGKEFSYNHVYNIDTDAPSLVNGVVDGDINVVDGIGYAKGSLTLKGDIVDKGSGVKYVGVFKDGAEVSKNLPYTIDSEGEYFIRLSDNIGNTSDIALKDIVGKDFTKLIIDSDAPEVEATINGKGVSSDWYKDKATLVISAKDDTKINSVKYTLNGKEFTEDVKNKNHEVSLKLEDYVDSNGVVNLEYVVTDCAGNESTYSNTIKVDTTVPAIENTRLSKSYVMVGDSAYIDGNVVLSADVTASNSSIASIEILKDGTVVGNKLPFTIAESGSYSIKVVDNAGHEVIKTLADLVSTDVNNIVIDSGSPELEVLINGNEALDTWYKDKASLVFKARDTKIKKVTQIINGVEFVVNVDNSSFEHTLELGNLVNNHGIVDVTFKVEDYLGNIELYNKEFKVDTNAPEVNNPSLKGNVITNNKIGYSNEDLILDASLVDSESGIASVEVLNDGNVVGNSLPYTIKDSGTYSLRVTDGVGHVVEKSFKDLTGLDIQSVVIDKNAPIVGVTINGTEVKNSYYKDNAKLVVNVNDSSTIRNIKYSLNGKETVVDVSNKDYRLSINLVPHLDDNGVVAFTFEAEDYVGNTTSYSKIIKVDTKSPVLENGSITGDIYEIGNLGYIKDSITLSADISDNESGVASIEVLKGNEVVSNSLPYRIDEDGSYSVRVTDSVGHVVTKTLKELTGLNINSIIVDNESPVIEAKIGNKDITDDWYKDNTKLVVNVSDSSSIKKIQYSLNGVSFEETVDNSKTKTVINLEEYVNEKGYVDFKYSAIDCLGNVSSYSKVIKVDTVNPRIENAKLDKEVFMLGNVAFIKDSITLTAEAFDDESGVAKVEVLRGSEVVSETLPYTIDKSGIYSVRVTDNVGHSITKSLRYILDETIDNIVVDNDAPVVKATIGGNEIHEEWYKDTANMVVKVEDSSSIKSIRYNINGTEFTDEVNSAKYETNINLEQYADSKGIVHFSYWALDSVGNETFYDKVIKVDTKDPELSNGTINGTVNIREGIGYTNDKITLSADTFDAESGVSSIEVYRDGSLVALGLPYTIDISGSYYVKVFDGVGHSITKTFKELTGVDADSIIVDKKAPVVTAKINNDEVKDIWYKDNARLVLKSEDTSPLKTVKCTVNGTEVNGVSTVTTNEISLDLEKYIDSNGLAEVVYTVEDYAGNSTVYSKVIKVDVDEPVLTNGSLEGVINILDSVAYINKEITLTASSFDYGSGVANVDVLKDGAIVSSKLPYTINSSGTYSIRVSDGVGHTVTKSLKELTGLDISKVVFDNETPIIKRLSGFTADLVKDNINWYRNVPALKLSIEDSNIKSVSIKVNEKEVINTISADCLYSIPIENIEGSYRVTVDVADKSENTSRDIFEFNVDHSNPSIDRGTLKGDYRNRGYGLYFNDNPTVSLEGTDSGVGIKDYILFNSNGDIVDRNSSGKFTLGNGEYYAKTIDYFGNESNVVSIMDLCNLESNRIVIDNTAPTIKASRPDGGLDGWFSKNVSYNIDLSDNVGINNAKVYINDVLVDSFEADKDVKNVSLVANTSKVYKEDGVYNIRVVVEDNTGYTSSWSDSIHIDMTAPEFTKGTILGTYVDRGDSIVFASNPSVQVDTTDNGVGVKEITIIDKDGNEVTNETGYFELTSNEYSFVVVDKLGNKSEPKPLSEICNLPSNVIIVDTDKPIINSIRPEGIIGNWFNGDVEYKVSASDSIGLSSVAISINGNEIVNYTSKDNKTLSNDFTVSTNGIPANSDGSYNVSIKAIDIVGNSSEWNDTVYIDTHAPIIDKFIITGKGYLEGDNINSSDKYGFYIDGDTDIEIHVSDGSYTSGMDKVYYVLVGADGNRLEGVSDIVNGVAKVSINKEFKGYIEAYATDMVGNKGNTNRPDGIISESSNTNVNTSKIDMFMPDTNYQDASGNNLYSDSVSIKANIYESVSGIRKVSWGINGETKGTVNIDNSGNMSGDTGSVLRKDKNLVVDFSKDLFIPNNENNMSVWVEVEDRVGHRSKNSRNLSIDKDAPVISVSYDTSSDDSFYNKNRVATVTIKERNFRSGDVKFDGVIGSVGEWSNIGNDTWVTNVVFSEDNDYQWSVSYTDMAGNIGNTYNSEKFTIDKTAPILNVGFDNNSVQSGNFYKDSRVATITVIEKNFDPSLVKLEGNGSIGGWSSSGDTHKANVVFDTDGEYDFSVSLSDKAKNASNSFSSGKFIIDKTKPAINISGVQNGVSYKKNAGFKVTLSDLNIDAERCVVTFSGRSIGDISLIGGINGNTGEFTFQGVPDDIKYDDLYSLKAIIYDKAGNVEEQNITYSINRYGSKFTFLDETLLNNIVSQSEDIVLEEMSVDRLDMSESKIVVIRDGQSLAIDSKYVKVEEYGGVDSNWVYRYTINKEAFSSDGKYQVQVYSKALDGSTNSSLSQEYAFILDTTAPEILVSGVESDSKYNSVSRNVTIEVRDISGIKSITALLNGKEVNLAEEDGIYSLSIPESSKKQNLVVEVVDMAGNIASYEVKDFLITTNSIISIMNSSLAKGLFVGIGSAVIFLLALLLKRRKATKREEMELAQEHAKMYHDSITGSSANSGGNSTIDD